MEASKPIRVLTIYFNGEIEQSELPLFRGAMIASMHGEADMLFHNHTGDTSLRYSYPLIQYKRIGRKPAVVGVDMGADILGQLLADMPGNTYQLGERIVRLEVERIAPTRIVMQTWNDTFSYTLRRWLPLNSDNYRAYVNTDNPGDKLEILERVLKGNLLSMCKGLGVFLDDELKVVITSVEPPRLVRHKGMKLMSFNISFDTNLSIPNGLGVGKSASLGYGTLFAARKKVTKKTDNKEISTE